MSRACARSARTKAPRSSRTLTGRQRSRSPYSPAAPRPTARRSSKSPNGRSADNTRGMFAIRTESLTKDFSIGFWRPRPYRALDSLNLEVATGETFGFLGPNGAGKTTTLKLLMQLIYPTSGHAEILERPVGDVDVKRRIGYLPESPYFYDYLTAEELLDYFARLFGYDSAERRRRVSALLDQVGIAAERRLPLRKFSKGMIQRVGIAQALINDPEVVFLDEPMSGLDPLGRRDVRNLILSLRDRGCTVFFSSHVLSDAEALCNRVAVLAGGRLVANGRISDLQAFDIRGWELIVSGRDRRIARAPSRASAARDAARRTTVFARAAARAGARAAAPRSDRRRRDSSCRSIPFAKRSKTFSSRRWRSRRARASPRGRRHDDRRHSARSPSACSGNRCATRSCTTSCSSPC